MFNANYLNKLYYYIFSFGASLVGIAFVQRIYHLSWLLLLYAVFYALLVMVVDFLIQPWFNKYPDFMPFRSAFLFVVLGCGTISAALLIPSLYIFMPFLLAFTLVYLAFNSTSKQTLTGAGILIITAVGFSFHPHIQPVLHLYVIGLGYLFIFGLTFIPLIYFTRQSLSIAQARIATSSKELASAYTQLRAYSEVLEVTSQQLDRKTLDLNCINTINNILNSRQTSEKLKAQVITQIAQSSQAAKIWLILENMATGGLSRNSLLNQHLLEETLPKPKNNSIYHTVFEEGQFLQLSTLEIRQRSQEIFWTKELPENLLIIPLFRTEGILGALILGDQAQPVKDEEITFLKIITGQISIALERIQMYQELKDSYLETIQALALSIEAKDPYTRGHSERVTYLAVSLGQALNLPSKLMEQLHFGSILHDIGKIGVPETILNKPGPLTLEEYRIIQKHTRIGAEIIKNIQFLHSIGPLILSHHEWFDGTGYPERLRGAEIPFPVRILTVCDSFDAMVSNRPYRNARTMEDCLLELEQHSGTQFDPEIVSVFAEMVREDPARFFTGLQFSNQDPGSMFSSG